MECLTFFIATNMSFESDSTFSPKISPYNADVIAVWANEIVPLQISNLSKFTQLVEDKALTSVLVTSRHTSELVRQSGE